MFDPKIDANRRLKIFNKILIVIMLLFTARLFSIQILQGEQFQSQTENNSQQVKIIPAQRGEIFDRHYDLPMVFNIDSFAVNITPGEIEKKEFPTVIARLANILQIPLHDIEKKLPAKIRKSFRIIEVKSSVPYETIVKIAENIDSLPGVSWRSKPIRSYVETGSFAHIIGYVGDITSDELKSYYNKGYTSNSIIGKIGIEKQYDEILKGKTGKEFRTVDVKGKRIDDTVKIIPAEPGKDLILTIDRNIQKLAEKALGPRIGAAVVLKPSNGEVLALVSYPAYNQNIFVQEKLSQQYVKLIKDKTNPLLNRSIAAKYPPASTFKVIMTAAILNEKAFPAEKKVHCPGEITYGRRTFRCHIRKPGHGYLNLEQALAKSCDIYFWNVCRDYLGIEKIIEYAEMFGLGQSAQIDLPTQSKGRVPNPVWKERKFHEKWLAGDTMNMSIGQGFTEVSPLQVANMVAMVVNDGIIYKPHVLKEIIDPDTGEIIETIKPEVLHKADIPASVFAKTRQAMYAVTTQGEARYPMNNPYIKLAGKTGTAEIGRNQDRWHSWMVAYGPYGAKPEDTIVVAVIVEAVNEWEWWAPYCANIILQGALKNQTFDEAVTALGFDNLKQIRRIREQNE
ncbi:MAG: penicillin-binding protein 2 [Treponema sp.]|nr:MAG: penicillin-binding protein 2 [Treponema sp.]